jgi:hypothetical protein
MFIVKCKLTYVFTCGHTAVFVQEELKEDKPNAYVCLTCGDKSYVILPQSSKVKMIKLNEKTSLFLRSL